MKEKISFIKWLFLRIQLIPKVVNQKLKWCRTVEGEISFGLVGGVFSISFLTVFIFESSPLWILIPSFLFLICLHGMYRKETEGDC